VKSKMEALKSLEEELKGMTGSATDSKPVAVLSAGRTSPDNGENKHPAVGGEMLLPTAEDTMHLLSSTQDNYETLFKQMTDLMEQMAHTKKDILERQRLYNVTPNIWPSESRNVTSGFGMRIDPFTSRVSFHDGLDIAGNTGDPVYATAEGKVSFTGNDRERGNYIVIDHAGGIQTMYMHLSQILVSSTGQLYGNSTSRSLVIEEGGVLQGQSKMEAKNPPADEKEGEQKNNQFQQNYNTSTVL